MRAKEFILEDADVFRAKLTSIVKWIDDVDENDEKQVKYVEQIYKTLHKMVDDNKDGLTAAFNAPLADEGWTDKYRDQVADDFMKMVFSLDASLEQTKDFVELLASPKGIVDFTRLKDTSGTFSGMLSGNAVAVQAFTELERYGVSRGLKGPGEFAMAMMSANINLSTKGDISVNGEAVEVKAGGSMGHQGYTRNAAINVLSNYYDTMPSLEAWAGGPGGSGGPQLALRRYYEILENDLPLGVPGNKEKRIEISTNIYKMLFDDAGVSRIVAQLAKPNNITEIESEYVRVAFADYQSHENWSALLLLNFRQQKTMWITSADQIIELRQKGWLDSYAIRTVPTAAGPRVVYPELKINMKAG